MINFDLMYNFSYFKRRKGTKNLENGQKNYRHYFVGCENCANFVAK